MPSGSEFVLVSVVVLLLAVPAMVVLVIVKSMNRNRTSDTQTREPAVLAHAYGEPAASQPSPNSTADELSSAHVASTAQPRSTVRNPWKVATFALAALTFIGAAAGSAYLLGTKSSADPAIAQDTQPTQPPITTNAPAPSTTVRPSTTLSPATTNRSTTTISPTDAGKALGHDGNDGIFSEAEFTDSRALLIAVNVSPEFLAFPRSAMESLGTDLCAQFRLFGDAQAGRDSFLEFVRSGASMPDYNGDIPESFVQDILKLAVTASTSMCLDLMQ